MLDLRLISKVRIEIMILCCY